jgi:hypothetical protein
MSQILDTMFENLVIYVWYNPADIDQEDFGAILVHAHDMDRIYEYTERDSNIVNPATSFDDLLHKLRNAEIPFYIIYNESIQIYVYNKDNDQE